MTPVFKDIIGYGIEKNYKFIYRNPCVINPDEYIDLYLEAKDVNLDIIWNKIKDVIEDKTNKTIIIVMKG